MATITRELVSADESKQLLDSIVEELADSSY